jgi:hypothetical protein
MKRETGSLARLGTAHLHYSSKLLDKNKDEAFIMFASVRTSSWDGMATDV